MVRSVKLAPPFRSRLAALGITVGARVAVLRVSPLRHTYLISTPTSRLIVSAHIAEGVELWTK